MSFLPLPEGEEGSAPSAYDKGVMYDVAFAFGLGFLAVGVLLVLGAGRRPASQEDIDRRFEEIVGRFGD